jgi:hypothetical protein
MQTKKKLQHLALDEVVKYERIVEPQSKKTRKQQQRSR